MFTLRIIEETRENSNQPFDQIIENYYLGDKYSILKKGDTKEFDKIMDEEFPNSNKKDLIGILCFNARDRIFIERPSALRRFTYYIISDNGKTFDRI